VRKAFKTSWGLKCPGVQRGKLLFKLADLIEANTDELAAIEAMDNGGPNIDNFLITSCRVVIIGKPWNKAKVMSVGFSVSLLRYYAGWADKFHGQTVEVCIHLILVQFVLLMYHFIRRLPKPNLPIRDMSHMA
jgi:aldehyde dehydrogenase (NAD+)